jgi:hypothetical protein
MSNRFQRRKDIALVRSEVSRARLHTYMLPADAKLDVPLLRNAVSWWLASVKARRPYCPACRANFADDARAGGVLLSTPAEAPTAASVTAFCTECLQDMPPDEVERHATRVLRRLIPEGRFL